MSSASQSRKKRKATASVQPDLSKRRTLPRKVLEPLLSNETLVGLQRGQQLQQQNVVAAMLNEKPTRNVLVYYMRECARELEQELRSRPCAQVGALETDCGVPLELNAEIERKVDALVNNTSDEGDRAHEDLLSVVNMYQQLANLLENKHSELRDVQTAQSLFLRTLCISPALQALVAHKENTRRLPNHFALPSAEYVRLMRHLEQFTTFSTIQTPIEKYVKIIRKFYFNG